MHGRNCVQTIVAFFGLDLVRPCCIAVSQALGINLALERVERDTVHPG